MEMSRRALLMAAAGSAAMAQDGKLTAAAVIDRIKAQVGVPWRTETVDKVVAGSPFVEVKGIATTMMAPLDAIQRASAEGKNMIISHEPTFYSHQDTVDTLSGDPVYEFKKD